MFKKKMYGALLIVVMVTILLLTFQSPAGTVNSETFRLWFERLGYYSDFHSFRSNAHIIDYSILGLLLCLYGYTCGWKWWLVFFIGFGF